MTAIIDAISSFVLPILTLVVGFAAGWLIRDIAEGAKLDKDSFAYIIAIFVTVTWVASVIVSMTTPEYTTALAVHAIMGAVAGFFFAGGKNPLQSGKTGDRER